MGYSDEARQALSQTPLNWRPTPPMQDGTLTQGQYTPATGAIDFNSQAIGDRTGTMAHEMSHKRWFEDLGAQNPAIAQDYLRDTSALARGGLDAAQGAGMDWQRDSSAYGPGANDWRTAPTETHARLAERVNDPRQLPDWYRSKWYPQVWNSNDVRTGNQTARFDNEFSDPVFGERDPETGAYGDIQKQPTLEELQAQAGRGLTPQAQQDLVGTPTVYTPGGDLEGGFEDGTIYLSGQPTDPLAPTLLHEYTHKRWHGNQNRPPNWEMIRDAAYASRNNPGITID
jgi:hypothetical protein